MVKKSVEDFRAFFKTCPNLKLYEERIREDEPYNSRTVGWTVTLSENGQTISHAASFLVVALERVYEVREETLDQEIEDFLKDISD